MGGPDRPYHKALMPPYAKGLLIVGDKKTLSKINMKNVISRLEADPHRIGFGLSCWAICCRITKHADNWTLIRKVKCDNY